MTKETKIGLLVGLAFIILFAIILSEKGPTQKGPDVPIFTIVDAAKTAGPPTPAGQPLRDAGRLPVDSQLGPIVSAGAKPLPAAPIKEEQIAQAPPEEEPLERLPDSLVGLLRDQPDQFEPARPLNVRTEPAEQEGAAIVGAVSGESRPADGGEVIVSKGQADPAAVRASDTTDDRIAEAAHGTRPEHSAEEKPPKLPPIKTEHIVQLGESLGKIAAKYYGRATPSRVEALFNSNRDTLANISSVKAGHKLKIPDLGEHADQFEAAPGVAFGRIVSAKEPAPRDGQVRIPIPVNEKSSDQAGERPRKSERAPTVAMASSKSDAAQDGRFDWYVVRKGDTLSKIARRELGSEKSAREIYRLNKDRLSDQNSLKPGTKIRMPSRAALGGETASALSSTGAEGGEP